MYRNHSTSRKTVTVTPVAASYLSSGNPVRNPDSSVKVDAAQGVRGVSQ